MSYRYKITVGLIMFFVLGLTLLTIIFGPDLLQAREACSIFEEFTSHIRTGNWDEAKQMLAPEAAPCLRVEKGKVFYWDADVTIRLSNAKPHFWATFNQNRNRQQEDKVVFYGGYVFLKAGKIEYIKII
ncbi:MAG: hypothetical protein ACYSTZ_12175 [Planctomycetota bacterium]|jgi:hypothetical protein